MFSRVSSTVSSTASSTASSTMPFFLVVMALIVTQLFLGGCDRYLKDRKAKGGPVEAELKEGQCLKDIPNVLTQYFQQTLSDSGLRPTRVCIDRAIGEFLSSTRGKDLSFYRSTEIHHFFQKYIFQRSIPLELIHELMKLKRAMIGGSLDGMTRQEVERLRILLGSIEAEMNRLYPHLSIYLFKEVASAEKPQERIVEEGEESFGESGAKSRSESGEENAKGGPPPAFGAPWKIRLDQALADLKISVTNLLVEVNFSETDYSLLDMEHLLKEIEVFAGLQDSNQSFSQWRENFPALEKFKSLIVGEALEGRSRREVQEIWGVLIDVYGLSLHYWGQLRTAEWTQDPIVREWDQWFHVFFDVLKKGFALRSKDHISFEQIDDFIMELHRREWLPKRLEPLTLQLAYRKFVKRFMESSPNAVTDELQGLRPHHLHFLQREYRSVKLIQDTIRRVMDGRDQRSSSVLVKRLREFNIQASIQEMVPLSPREQTFLRQSWNEFLFLVERPVIRHWDHRGRVSVQTKGRSSWSYSELTRMNFLRLPTSLLIRTYADPDQASLAPEDRSLSRNNLKALFNDFNLFGEQMRFFDPRSRESYRRSLREADLFTPESNGDDRAQYIELFDLFAIMWSGGLQVVTDLRTGALVNGCNLEILDPFDFPYMKMECASNTLRRSFSQFFPHLPLLSAYVERLTSEEWEALFVNLLKVSQVCPELNLGFETGDQRTLFVILHYIEGLFTVFDRNGDGTLNEREVERAFPRFSSFITTVTKKRVEQEYPKTYALLDAIGYSWEGMALDVFKFIVFEGRRPEGSELLSYMAGDLTGLRGDLGEADRQSIVKVFAVLKSEISTASFQCHPF